MDANSHWSDDYSDNESELYFVNKGSKAANQKIEEESPAKSSKIDDFNFSIGSFIGSEMLTSEQFTFKQNSIISKFGLLEHSSNTDFTFNKFGSKLDGKSPLRPVESNMTLSNLIYVKIDRASHPKLFEKFSIKVSQRSKTPKIRGKRLLLRQNRRPNSDSGLVCKLKKDDDKSIPSIPKHVRSKSKPSRTSKKVLKRKLDNHRISRIIENWEELNTPRETTNTGSSKLVPKLKKKSKIVKSKPTFIHLI